MDGIGEQVRSIIAKHLEIAPIKVVDSAELSALGADSLDAMELAIEFEDAFDCEIPEAVAETLLTVGDIVTYIEKNAKS